MPSAEAAWRGASARGLPYRPDIDGLRGVAVALVVLYHALPRALPGAFTGVDVFFVISGYLITQLILVGLMRGDFSLAEFYRRRVRRIVPALLAVLAACALFGWFALLPREFAWLGRSIAWCAPFLANVFFARYTAYFDPGTVLNVLLHLWSLGVEEQFYLVWPLLMMLTVARGIAAQVLVAVLVTSLAISAWGAWYAPATHFFLPGARAWELALGGLLARYELSAAHAPAMGTRQAQLRAPAGLLLVAGGAAWLSSDNPFPGLWALVPTTGAALLIAAGPAAWLNRRVLASRPLVWVGKLSYPLYLWHWPMFSLAFIVAGRRLSPAGVALAVALAVAAAWATYRWVEVPIRYGTAGRRASWRLLAALSAATVLGWAIALQWLPARLSSPVFAPLQAALDDRDFSGESQVDPRTGLRTLVAPAHSAHTALFIGDSHMLQYWPRVKQVIAAQPETARAAQFATYTGCVPLPGLESRRQPRDCTGLFEQATRLAQRHDVDTVVFGAFWELYLMGEYATGQRAAVYAAGDLTRAPLELDSPAARTAWRAFERTVAELVASGRRVFIVLSNPTSPQFDPRSMFPIAVRFAVHAPARLNLQRRVVDASGFEAYVAPLTRRFQEIAQRTGASLLDPRVTLCSDAGCPTTGSDDLPLYLDSNHLRGAYARSGATFLDVALLGTAR